MLKRRDWENKSFFKARLILFNKADSLFCPVIQTVCRRFWELPDSTSFLLIFIDQRRHPTTFLPSLHVGLPRRTSDADPK